ncbi:hypothetical protein GVN20_12405 [Runella sp. CRIBMP]|uniref:hypothetical protein n=1 Tax=Runella sp. CRIBMP TaxID=2683261 RepID=UPI00141253FB|nr:hypothetical protein [Runella sp. CRIBMP]NBB20157.1 hypothetical protein [Runella sp. CRIBMP]
MNTIPKTEFYADRAVDQIGNVIKIIYKIIWWIWPTVFWICFFSLWFVPKDMMKVLQDMGSRLLAILPVPDTVLYTFALLPFWLWLVGELLSSVVKIVRKYMLYPKSDFTETAMVTVEKKELIVHHSSKSGTSRSYLIWIKRPVSQSLMKVNVEQAGTFEKIKEGNPVAVKHLLTPTNIVYLTVE